MKFFLLIFLFSCSSGDVFVKKKLINLEFSGFENFTTHSNLNTQFDTELKKSVLESGTFKYKSIFLNKIQLFADDFSTSKAEYIITGELNSFSSGNTNKFQIPLIVYTPSFFCELRLSLYIYNVAQEKLQNIQKFDVTKVKPLGLRFFSVDENDPDLIIKSSEKNALINEALHELSEKVVDYLVSTIK